MTSQRACIEALRAAAERLGESPTKAQYEALDLQPSASTILRVCGGWNAAKERAGLETYDTGETGVGEVQPKPDGVEIPSDREWAELSSQQRWYYRNRRERIERKDRRRRELRRWLYEYKRDECACERCGEDRPACLDFHHTDEKHLGVAEMVNHGYARERILAEIRDCVVLCANCHRVEHYDRPDDDGPQD